jgi:uncharacterized repeat protein (TIGR03803 family)
MRSSLEKLCLDCTKQRWAGRAVFCAALAWGAGCIPSALAASFTSIYSFTGGADGGNPSSRLVPDAAGNLYSVTRAGGDLACLDSFQGCGTIFKLDRRGNLTTLHAFTGGAQGGIPSSGVSVIRGMLYGGGLATTAGFTGVVYSLNTDGSDYTILHDFTSPDGVDVQGRLQPALGGGEFGIARQGGTFNNGTLFYVGPRGQFEVVHNFGGATGADPIELIEDASGNVFGSTFDGGAGGGGSGVVFEYAQSTHMFSVIYTFQNGADGNTPRLGVVGPGGTLYGVSSNGGSEGHGALFSLTPSAGGGYTFKVLTPIESKYRNDYATNPPALSSAGALLGSTAYGGTYEYQNGQYTINYKANDANPFDAYWTPPANSGVFLNTSNQGGASSCAIPDITSCGFIYGISP